MTAHKSISERIFQAIGFELLAILICTPLLAWIMQKPMLEMGAVTVLIALLALGWNVMGVPLIAWWLSVSLWQAFLLDIGVLLFFLPYTYVYHWGYDVLRERFMTRNACQG
jgi:uncharacterized membrane protein